MEAFAICRAEKVSQGTETAAHNHNLRASKTKKENNVDYSSSHKNELLLGTRNTVATINAKVEQRTNKKKLRADANRAIEFVLSASPEHFYNFEAVGMTREEWDNLTPSNFEGRMSEYWGRLNEVKATIKQDKLDKWKHDTVEWVKKEFGQNVVNLVLHLDEKTPHAHLLTVPLTKEGKLSAKDFFNPDTAKRWQDDYAKATGLKRGIASERRHEELKEQVFNVARKEGAKAGYNKYKKIGFKKGLEEGKAEGLADVQKVGAKVGGWWSSLKDKASKPTERELQAIAEAKAEAEKAKKEQAKAQEEARSAKVQADNRVSAVANQLQAEKARADEIAP